jgi:hypothetical protein
MGRSGKCGNSFRVIHLLDDKLHEYLNYFLMVYQMPNYSGVPNAKDNSIYPSVTPNLCITHG